MNESTLSNLGPDVAGQSGDQAWRPPKEMMIMCPLFMVTMLIVPILILRRLSRLEKAVKARQGEGDFGLPVRAAESLAD